MHYDWLVSASLFDLLISVNASTLVFLSYSFVGKNTFLSISPSSFIDATLLEMHETSAPSSDDVLHCRNVHTVGGTKYSV